MRVQNPYLRITLFQLVPGAFILLCAYLGSFIPARSGATRGANEMAAGGAAFVVLWLILAVRTFGDGRLGGWYRVTWSLMLLAALAYIAAGYVALSDARMGWLTHLGSTALWIAGAAVMVISLRRRARAPAVPPTRSV